MLKESGKVLCINCNLYTTYGKLFGSDIQNDISVCRHKSNLKYSYVLGDKTYKKHPKKLNKKGKCKKYQEK